MIGRQGDRHRPSAPATDVHVGGTPSPAVSVIESGAQKPPGQVASLDWSAIGTSDDGTQWAPPHAGVQAGNTVGSMIGGPLYGQVRMIGGYFGMSQATPQAPVGVLGFVDVGS